MSVASLQQAVQTATDGYFAWSYLIGEGSSSIDNQPRDAIVQSDGTIVFGTDIPNVFFDVLYCGAKGPEFITENFIADSIAQNENLNLNMPDEAPMTVDPVTKAVTTYADLRQMSRMRNGFEDMYYQARSLGADWELSVMWAFGGLEWNDFMRRLRQQQEIRWR